MEINFEAFLKNLTEPNLTCNFDTGLCDWSQEESRDSEDWVTNFGNKKLKKLKKSIFKANIFLKNKATQKHN